MASTMSEALREYFTESRGIRTKEEVTRWIERHYRDEWAPGTLRDHLYGGRVNHPLAYKHHPGQKKFLFDHGEHRYELYDAEKHGVFRLGRKIADVTVPSWILIHGASRYADADPDNPKDELALLWPRKRWDRLWHWKRGPHPLKEDNRARTILLAWDSAVFGEATATVTREIGDADPARFNFAFRLLSYRPLRTPIPFSALKLGRRANEHRDLVSITSEVLQAYRAALRGQRGSSEQDDISEAAQNEAAIESGVNPHHSRQGFGLTAKEKQCVELHAMNLAAKHLAKKGYETKDVSKRRSFDILAERKGETLSVEVKGTTGQGAEILLTKNEVQFQRMSHPANMLIVVHSISLKRGTNPNARGGQLRAISPWHLDDEKLSPSAYSYKI